MSVGRDRQVAMVDFALVLPPRPDERWDLARQMGVRDAVIHPIEIGDGRTEWRFDELLTLRNWLDERGLRLRVMEGSVPITDRIRLGAPGRDEDIERFKRFLRHCGALDIDVVCYDWLAGFRVTRTDVFVEARGGSYVSAFDAAKIAPSPTPPPITTTHEALWEALEHFLMAVLPVAEAADVRLALHPDDPPCPAVSGVPRIVTSPEAYDRVLAIEESEYNGMTFCQGNFAAMGADIPSCIRRFGDRINFVHFRDVAGDADRFRETWHDEGPTDMLAAMEAYVDIGFDGPMRPDHVPTMAGEDNSNPGYHTKGRLWAIGYMQGLLEAVT